MRGRLDTQEYGEFVRTSTGYIPYSIVERVAICVESGLSEREALHIAQGEYQQWAVKDLWRPGATPDAHGR